MAESQTPEPAPITKWPTEAILIPLAIILIPIVTMILVALIVIIIKNCIKTVTQWLLPYYRHRRTEPLLAEQHELEEFDTPNYHTHTNNSDTN